MLLRATNLLYFLLLFIHVNLFASNILDKINSQEDILDVKEAFKISLLVINNDAVIKWNTYAYLCFFFTKWFPKKKQLQNNGWDSSWRSCYSRVWLSGVVNAIY